MKRRFNDELDYAKYEPKIQKLINQHLSTTGEVLQITELVDVFDKKKREEELAKIKGTAAQADHIASRTKKVINIKMDEDPVYYKRISELIQQTIDDYLQKRIDEAAYLKQMQEIEKSVHYGKNEQVPKALQNRERAISFYHQATLFPNEQAPVTSEIAVEISLYLDAEINARTMNAGTELIDWRSNDDIQGQIKIEAGDGVHEICTKHDIAHTWDEIDLFIENCLKIARARR